ncbi:MAG: glycosyltransferase family 39 protein [Anaerolineae bacterium]|nr:glycosyltransferase family 39 protein [Anaerolineae bacterium]
MIRGWRLALMIVAIATILCFAAYVRLENVASTPGWYTDEGTHILIAQNLIRGRVQYMAIDQSWLLFGRMPLFEWLLAGIFRWSGVGIEPLRVLTGVLGVVSLIILGFVVYRISRDTALSLLAMATFAIDPQAVLFSRFGFSYSLLAPLVLTTLLGLWLYIDENKASGLVLATLSIGVGSLSDLWMLMLLPALCVVVLLYRWRDVMWSLLLGLLPFALYSIVMLFYRPQAFAFDFGYTFWRLSHLSLVAQISNLAFNYTVLVTQGPWWALALLGWFLLRPVKLRWLSLSLGLLTIALLGRTVDLYNLSAYYVIPLLPLVSLGVASTLRYGVPVVRKEIDTGLSEWTSRRGWGAALKMGVRMIGYGIIAAIVATPFLVMGLRSANQTRTGFSTELEPVLIHPRDAWEIAADVNRCVSLTDVVLASPGVAWLFAANVADFQMAAAADGRATPHLPDNIAQDRFAFDPRYTSARLVVVDNIWRTWGAANVPGVAEMLPVIETWPKIAESGALVVYQNPVQPACP